MNVVRRDIRDWRKSKCGLLLGDRDRGSGGSGRAPTCLPPSSSTRAWPSRVSELMEIRVSANGRSFAVPLWS